MKKTTKKCRVLRVKRKVCFAGKCKTIYPKRKICRNPEQSNETVEKIQRVYKLIQFDILNLDSSDYTIQELNNILKKLQEIRSITTIAYNQRDLS
jgi:hypothetical protein